MYLICYGTRPELIKLFPIINEFKKLKIKHKTFFTGQHLDLIKDFSQLSGQPDYHLENTMEHNQSLNSLFSKIVKNSDEIIAQDDFKVIVQGDSSTSYAAALAAFYNKKDVIHIEAGLRTHNLQSPFPEEGNRVMISHIANMHFCPTRKSVENLNKEGIQNNVYLVGNTVVDSYNLILKNFKAPSKISEIIKDTQNYYLATLHRRENRNNNFIKIWNDLNTIAKNKKIIYITHPSVPDASSYLDKSIIQIDPVNYSEMLYLIQNCSGIISDSGGLQEEAVCAKKKILICRDTTERPETIEYGYGKLVGTNVLENLEFLQNKLNTKKNINPYGENVSSKIAGILIKT